ncbi:MAG: isopentenyl-diphosphate Delta-isomerase [Bacteroidales bacterium]
MGDLIALVNQDDSITGYADKMYVHSKGLLHRAFSIIIFNAQKEMLIHRRADEKYHSPGLWTNACCSHLPKDTSMDEVIYDRLSHEMGFSCVLSHAFTFHYKVDFDHGLVENEIDHVYFGCFDGCPNPNVDEVSEWKWIPIDKLYDEIQNNPDDFTYWFKHIALNYRDEIQNFCCK